MHSVEFFEFFLSLDFSKMKSNFGHLAMSKIAILTALEALNLLKLVSLKILKCQENFSKFHTVEY